MTPTTANSITTKQNKQPQSKSPVLSSKVQGASNSNNNSATEQNLSNEQFSRKVVCQIEKSAMEASRKVDD